MLTAVIERPSTTAPAEAVSASADAIDERALVAAAARGEVAAFETLYRRHLGRVH